MKRIGLLLAVVVVLSAQTPATAPATERHLVYEFGYNTKAASQGNGTGTTTVDISPAADGGMMVSASDYWWNTARARATNTCEVYPNGNVNCKDRPYALSPIQLTLFPLLGRTFFKGAGSGGTSSWEQSYTVYAAVIPGATGAAGAPNNWKCTFELHGKGPISGAGGAILVQDTGTLEQTSGRYWKATSKQRIAYLPSAHVPVAVSDVRTHIPMRSVYSNDLVELKLIKDSMKH
jgi:hypothetical protein